MIETPTAVFNVREIAAHPRVAVLVMGTNDLAKELRSPLVPSRHPLVPHLAAALLAAREAGKVILDGVYNDVKNPDGFESECRQGMEMGFDGKTLIHPSQVEPANTMWAPSVDDIEYAQRGDRRVRRGSRRRSRRRHRRRPHDREPPRRQRSPRARNCGCHRRARLTCHQGWFREVLRCLFASQRGWLRTTTSPMSAARAGIRTTARRSLSLAGSESWS